MPYSDPEKRRQYNTRYKKRWRKARTKIHPLLGFKIYICPRFPYLRLAGACFDSGFLITSDVAVQAHVEAHPEFGKFIFPLAMDLTCTPREEEEDEEIY
jgi:hypothetical protein